MTYLAKGKIAQRTAKSAPCLARLTLLCFLVLALVPSPSRAEGTPAKEPGPAGSAVLPVESAALQAEYRLMITRRSTPVHSRMRRGSKVIAQIGKGAVIRVGQRARQRRAGCPRGWVERQGGGYICVNYLKKTDETAPRPAADDKGQDLAGLDVFRVTKSGPRLYRQRSHIDDRAPVTWLYKGSVLWVRQSFTRYGSDFHETRRGWILEARSTEQLPPPLESALGVELSRGQGRALWGIVVGQDAAIHAAPDGKVVPGATLERWVPIWSKGKELPGLSKGWVKLPDGRGYLRDQDVALLRPAPVPANLGQDEQWIAVDLTEQLLHAYQGERLVRLIPCATGIDGKTPAGQYQITWKVKMKTLSLRLGHLRVEDVPWVMYFDRDEALAIHSAYWHRDFGRPVSHGCVNLTLEDARWLFGWTTPQLLPEESERFALKGKRGTAVVVFGQSAPRAEAPGTPGALTH